jgi:hypothetical protein
MIDDPVPTMPLRVPATSPTARTKMKFKALVSAKPGRRCLIPDPKYHYRHSTRRLSLRLA